MGYQNITVTSGFSIFAPTFKDVTAETYDLTDILPLHQDGDEFGTSGSRRCNGAIKINKINSTGNYTTTYSFYTMPAKSGWYDGDTKVEAGDVVLTKGEAILVNNLYKSMPVLFRVSGEVDLVPTNVIPAGFALYGNSTPVTVNLSAIAMLHQDGDPFGKSGARRCNGAIKINKISTGGNYTTTYSFYTMPTKSGWYDGDTKIEGDAVTFAPGEAFLINNLYKSMPVLIKLPSAVVE